MTTLIAGGILLGVLVFFHELGHFLVAKAVGVKVLTFSLGFGPRLFGFRRGDTDYRISALPLGGYVRMYGDDATEEIPVEEQSKSFLHKPFLQKSAIAVAGPVANFILPVVVFTIAFMGTERINDSVVGTVFPDEPAAMAGLQAGDRITAVDGVPVSTFPEVQQKVELKPLQPVRFTVVRSEAQHELVVTPRAAASGKPLSDEKVGRIGITPMVELPVVSVAPGSVAATAGLRSLDRVLEVDGRPVATRAELFAALDRDPQAPLRLKVQGQPEAPATAEGAPPAAAVEPPPRDVVLPPGDTATPPALADQRVAVTADELPGLAGLLDANRKATTEAVTELARRRGLASIDGLVMAVEAETTAASAMAKGDRIVALDGRPLRYSAQLESALNDDKDGVHAMAVLGEGGVKQVAFRLQPSPDKKMADMKVFGAVPASAYGPGHEVLRHVSLGEAFTRAGKVTWGYVVLTVKSFGMLLTGQVGLNNLGGPIMIFNIAGDAAERGLFSYLNILALISVNLGILNLLPVPVLDGGHLMMFSIEAVRRKKLSLKTRERFAKVGLAFVLALMVLAIGNDIWRVIG